MAHLVEMRGIHKRFGGLHALRGVDLHLDAGEVLGLVGDNAAGKSTLMKVLTGRYLADEGELFFDNKPVDIQSPQDSRALGVEMIYQDFALVGELDAVANIFMAKEMRLPGVLGFFGLRDERGMRRRAGELFDKLRLERVALDASAVANLSGGQRQAVAIARAVMFDPRVIIMDEPTANLDISKVGQLLEHVRRLKELGVSVILISHRLQEVLDVGDRVMVLRRGEVAGVREVGGTTVDEVVKLMIGAEAA